MALNESALNVEAVNGNGSVNFLQSLIIASTITFSFLKGVSLIKSLTSAITQSLVVSKVKNVLLSIGSTVTVTTLRVIGKLVSYLQG